MSSSDRRQEERRYKPTAQEVASRLLVRWAKARRAKFQERRFPTADMDIDNGDVEVILREGYGQPIVSNTRRHIEL